MTNYLCSYCNEPVKLGQKKCKACGEELDRDATSTEPIKKKSNFRRWVLALNRPIIGVIWLIISIIFRLLGIMDVSGTGLDIFKSIINRLLGMMSLFGLPGMVVGIVMLVKNKK